VSGALTGQQVVVVGGASGIGLSLGDLARDAGAIVHVFDLDAEALARVGSRFPGSQHAVVDVRDEAAVSAAFLKLGSIDHVYVAAAFTRPTSILEGPLEPQLDVLKVRLWGSLHVVRAAAPKLRAKGSITFTGGVSSDRPVPGAWATNVGTAATEQLARTLAIELKPLRFNAVAPGWTDTPMWERVLGAQRAHVFAEVSQKQLIGRLGTASEVARAVLFLMTNDAVTGEVLHVDGGGRLT
jgi:NAD(P)-dependent dehydrogenase (short-subunit alcohol dehydrogenase family)